MITTVSWVLQSAVTYYEPAKQIYDAFQPIANYAKCFLGLEGKEKTMSNFCALMVMRVDKMTSPLLPLLKTFPQVAPFVNTMVVGCVAALTLDLSILLDILKNRSSKSKAIELEVSVKASFAYLEDRLRKIGKQMEVLEKLQEPLEKLKENGSEGELKETLKKYHDCLLFIRLDIEECVQTLNYLQPKIYAAIKELDGSSGIGNAKDAEAKERLQDYQKKCDEFKNKLNTISSSIREKEKSMHDSVP